MSDGIRRTAERLVHENAFVRVYDDEVVFPSGRTGTHLRIEPVADGPGVVLVVRDGDRLALVETYRYPLGRTQLGFPRGYSHGADVEATARAEAREELGVELDDVRVVGYVTPDSGLQSTRVAVVTATAAGTADGERDTDEVIDVRWVTDRDLVAMARQGALDDGITLSALALITFGAT